MKIHNIALPLVLAGLGTVLSAQSAGGTDYFMKMRVLAGSKSQEGQRNGLGIGIGGEKVYSAGKLSLELAYTYLPGKIFRADFDGRAVAAPGYPAGADQSNSVLTKKGSVDMLGVRLAFARKINEAWDWHAGLGLAMGKSRLETIGDFQHQTGTTTVNGQVVPVRAYDGGWTMVPERSSTVIVPFGGVKYQVTEGGSLDFNLAVYSYEVTDVTPVFTNVPVTGGRVKPVIGNKSINDLKLEVAYVFHF